MKRMIQFLSVILTSSTLFAVAAKADPGYGPWIERLLDRVRLTTNAAFDLTIVADFEVGDRQLTRLTDDLTFALSELENHLEDTYIAWENRQIHDYVAARNAAKRQFEFTVKRKIVRVYQYVRTYHRFNYAVRSAMNDVLSAYHRLYRCTFFGREDGAGAHDDPELPYL